MIDDIPRYMYHTIYYVTKQSETREALEEFVNALMEKGFSIEFINKMQFDVFPKSKITEHIAVSAQYWN